MDPSGAYPADMTTADIIPATEMTAATISLANSDVYEQNYAAFQGNVDFEIDFGSRLLQTDYLELTFGAEFFLKSDAGTVSCFDETASSASLACTPTWQDD